MYSERGFHRRNYVFRGETEVFEQLTRRRHGQRADTTGQFTPLGNKPRIGRQQPDAGLTEQGNTPVEGLIGALKGACPKGVDVYFDNVGGDMLDAALAFLNQGARIPLCGGISQYNEKETRGPKNYLSILVNRARMEGFVIFDFVHKYNEALQELGQWVAAGKIKARYDVVEGLENAPAALLRLFDGSKKGKLMVKVGDEPS